MGPVQRPARHARRDGPGEDNAQRQPSSRMILNALDNRNPHLLALPAAAQDLHAIRLAQRDRGCAAWVPVLAATDADLVAAGYELAGPPIVLDALSAAERTELVPSLRRPGLRAHPELDARCRSLLSRCPRAGLPPIDIDLDATAPAERVEARAEALAAARRPARPPPARPPRPAPPPTNTAPAPTAPAGGVGARAEALAAARRLQAA